jgi:hypothetical protein
LALKQFYIKNVGTAKIQRVQQKIPGCWTYVQQNENKFQKVCMYTPTFPTLALYSMFVLYRILVYSSLDRIPLLLF